MPKAKVLIAEDESQIRKIMVMALTVLDNIEVIEASDGSQALEKIRADRPDVISLDLMMPKMDGMEVLEALQSEEGAGTRAEVLVVSALVKPGLQENLERLGVRHMMTKPFGLDDFANKVGQLIANRA